MKTEKKEKLVLMFQRVNTLMEANLEKWKNISEMRSAYDEFVSHLKKFRDLQPDLELALSPKMCNCYASPSISGQSSLGLIPSQLVNREIDRLVGIQ